MLCCFNPRMSNSELAEPLSDPIAVQEQKAKAELIKKIKTVAIALLIIGVLAGCGVGGAFAFAAVVGFSTAAFIIGAFTGVGMFTIAGFMLGANAGCYDDVSSSRRYEHRLLY